MRCPNCGFQHADDAFAPELDDLRLPNLQYDVVLRLRQARGATVTNEQLVDFLYGDRADGGPDHARNGVQAFVSKVRRKIRPLGWTISSDRFRGYRLERLP